MIQETFVYARILLYSIIGVLGVALCNKGLRVQRTTRGLGRNGSGQAPHGEGCARDKVAKDMQNDLLKAMYAAIRLSGNCDLLNYRPCQA